MEKSNKKEVYRIQGLTCANCAQKFEDNVKKIKDVQDAQVNFAAAKITVIGNTSIEEIEKAGAFEQLVIVEENKAFPEDNRPFYLRNLSTFVSFMFLLLGLMSVMYVGEGHNFTNTLYAIAILIGGFSLFKTGLINIFQLRFDMKTLMTIAIIGAAIIGQWQEGAIVVILFAISEMLEKFSMEKARKSIQSLMEIAPKEATIIRNGKEQKVSIEKVKVGDVLLVKPGQKIATDGKVIKGTSMVNQSAITGESIPVLKEIGQDVFAGTLNEDSILEIKVTKKYEDSTIAKMIHLVEEANNEKAPAQKFIDKFAKYYTPIIMFIALLVAIVPPLVVGADWKEWIYQGLAVLVVGCPCALVISTPVAIVTAIGTAARNGVLIKGGIYLEEAASIDVIAFDKTGTLTVGVPKVESIVPFNHASENDFLRVSARMEQGSLHPLAKAILEKATVNHIKYEHLEMKDYKSVVGKGVKARVEGTLYHLGNLKLFANVPYFEELKQQLKAIIIENQSIVILGTNEKLIGIALIADEIRSNSKDTLAQLNKMQLETIMLTGDNEMTASAVTKKIGMTTYFAELLPETKLTKIKQWMSEGKKVAMVGDGVNDAPALAQSTIGIAMGKGGTDTALETANIVLMGDDLDKLPFTFKLAKRMMAIIKQNIVFSIGLKLLALLLVIPGWLTLWIAIIADIGATLLVTFNSLRLLKK